MRIETRNIEKEDIARIQNLLSARSWDTAAPKQTFGSHFDPALGQVIVEGTGGVDVFAPVLSQFPGKVTYRQGDAERLSRQSDIAPHWGGAAITDGTYACTSGFSVKNASGTRFMVTAGHCFPINDPIVSPGNGQSFGRVTNRAPFPSRDLELLGTGNYGTYIYVGDLTGTGVPVKGASDPVVGASYCYSGQVTAENCGEKVSDLNGQFCDASGCTSGVAVWSGGGVPGAGDSGSPFYIPGSGTVYIRGILFAKSCSLFGCSMYSEKWSTIANQFGVSIVTSS